MKQTTKVYTDLLASGILAKGGKRSSDGRISLATAPNIQGPHTYIGQDGTVGVKISNDVDGQSRYEFIHTATKSLTVHELEQFTQQDLETRFSADSIEIIADLNEQVGSLQDQVVDLQSELAIAMSAGGGDGEGRLNCAPVTFNVEYDTLRLNCITPESRIFVTFDEYGPGSIWHDYQWEFSETGINLEDTETFPPGTQILAVATHPSFNTGTPSVFIVPGGEGEPL